MKRILIVAGDPSGDLVAAQLVESLKRLEPGLEVTGVGGSLLEKVSDKFLANIVRKHALYDAIWIQSAISRLKPALRDTAVLVVGQQLNHAEVAAILGVAEPTIAWRMHEVRRILSAGSNEGE